MARSHARLKVSIHRDADWLERSPEAKLTYYTLLSDPKLTIAGVMELAEKRWGRNTGYDLATLTAALVELEGSGYVVVDGDTDELLIRTLAKHDLDPGRLNKNIGKGYWGAWGMVESPILRSVIVHELDDQLWAGLEDLAPKDAKETRRSERLEPETHFRLEPQSEFRSQPPPSSLLSPVTSRQPESRPCAADRRARLEAAAAVIGERAAGRRGVDDSEAVRRAVIAAVVRDRYQDAYAILADEPDLSPEDLAERLEPTAATTSRSTNGAPVIGHDPRGAVVLHCHRDVREVIEGTPQGDPEEAAAAIASIRSELPFLNHTPKGPAA